MQFTLDKLNSLTTKPIAHSFNQGSDDSTIMQSCGRDTFVESRIDQVSKTIEQWRMVVIVLGCALFVMSQYDVMFTFPIHVCWSLLIQYATGVSRGAIAPIAMKLKFLLFIPKPIILKAQFIMYVWPDANDSLCCRLIL